MIKKLLLLSLLTTLVAPAFSASDFKNKGNFGIAGWLVYWDPASMEVYEKNAAHIDRVYPEWYVVGPDGMPQDVGKGDPGVDPAEFQAKKKKTVAIAKANGIQVIYMIVNFDNKKMMHSTERVQMFLYDADLRKRHIAALVNNAIKDGASGIDIDYENLKKKDAPAFSAFMRQLRLECDKNNLVLATAVMPKTDADGTWDGNQAMDYPAIGKAVHLFRPMTYDEHWGTSTAGPVSSPEFTEMVDRYSSGVMSPGRVELGIAGYGYDWHRNKGTTVVWKDFVELQKKYGKAERDEETWEMVLEYTDEQGKDHEVWFCDAMSYRPKYDIIRRYGLAGLAMWRFGSEDPAFWTDMKKFKYAKDWKKDGKKAFKY